MWISCSLSINVEAPSVFHFFTLTSALSPYSVFSSSVYERSGTSENGGGGLAGRSAVLRDGDAPSARHPVACPRVYPYRTLKYPLQVGYKNRGTTCQKPGKNHVRFFPPSRKHPFIGLVAPPEITRRVDVRRRERLHFCLGGEAADIVMSPLFCCMRDVRQRRAATL